MADTIIKLIYPHKPALTIGVDWPDGTYSEVLATKPTKLIQGWCHSGYIGDNWSVDNSGRATLWLGSSTVHTFDFIPTFGKIMFDPTASNIMARIIWGWDNK